MGGLVVMADLQSSWLIDFASCGCCRTKSLGGCETAGGPRTSAGLLVVRARVQEILGLLPTDLWLKPGPLTSGGPLAERTES